MKPNTHKNCGGKYGRKGKRKKGGGVIYICNRCGEHYIGYRKINVPESNNTNTRKQRVSQQ
jgi:hypothetical protein